MHDAITRGVPVLAIFFGILLNQRGLADLKGDMKGDVADLKGSLCSLESKIDRMQADLHQFNRELGRHDARLDALESKQG